MKIINLVLFAASICLLPVQTILAQDKNENKNQSGEDNSKEETRKAVTDSGENVILYSDGTWEFAPEESTESVKRTINNAKFVIPALSKEILVGNTVNYEIHYEIDKWKNLDKNINEMAEYSLLHKDKNAYAIIIPEVATIPLETLRNIVVNNARSVSKSIKILKEEERIVNGSKVIMLNIKAVVQGMNFIYMYYIYSGEKSSIQVIGFTTEELFSTYKNDIEDLLNGFVVKETEKKTTSEVKK